MSSIRNSRRIPTGRCRAGPFDRQYSYQTYHFTGKGFICVGDAHRFVDPIYSFGLCISLKEAEAASDAVKDYLNGRGATRAPFAPYEIERERGIESSRT